jgi:hypothetical protein
MSNQNNANQLLKPHQSVLPLEAMDLVIKCAQKGGINLEIFNFPKLKEKDYLLIQCESKNWRMYFEMLVACSTMGK